MSTTRVHTAPVTDDGKRLLMRQEFIARSYSVPIHGIFNRQIHNPTNFQLFVKSQINDQCTGLAKKLSSLAVKFTTLRSTIPPASVALAFLTMARQPSTNLSREEVQRRLRYTMNLIATRAHEHWDVRRTTCYHTSTDLTIPRSTSVGWFPDKTTESGQRHRTIDPTDATKRFYQQYGMKG